MSEYKDFSDRIIIDFDDVKNGLSDVLDEVRTLRSDSLIRQILSKDDQEKIKQWEKLINKHADEEFSIVIMGDFKRGKSTLINAILGENIAPMDVSPETITINKISHSDQPRREALLKNGKRIRLNSEELTRSELENIMKNLSSPIEYIDIYENIEILKEITIVDTPGLGDLMNSYNQQVQDYLSNADAVIYVVSVLSPLSETEQAYLCASILPQSFSQLFVVANMSDCLESVEDIEKVKREIENRVSAFSDKGKVYAISALDEYCRKCSYKRPNSDLTEYLEKSFETFYTDIQNEMILKKDIIKSQRLIALAKIMSRDIRDRITLIGNMLKANISELEEMSLKCEEENANLHNTISVYQDKIKSIFDDLSLVAKRWMSDFLTRLRAEIDSVKRNADTTTIQKHFQFYMMDTVRDAILSCINAHRPIVEGELREMVKNFSATNLFEDADKKDFNLAVNIADISWTGVDSAMFLATDGLLLMGINSPIAGIKNTYIGIIGQAVAGFIRQSKLKDKKPDLLGPVLENFGSIEDSVYEQVTKSYENMSNKASEKLISLFEAEIANSQGAIKQAIEISENKEMQAINTEDQLKNALNILDNIDSIIEKFE